MGFVDRLILLNSISRMQLSYRFEPVKYSCCATSACVLFSSLLMALKVGMVLRCCYAEFACVCRVLRGHRGSVLTLFALQGLLLSGGRDNIIRVWVRTPLDHAQALLLHRGQAIRALSDAWKLRKMQHEPANRAIQRYGVENQKSYDAALWHCLL